MSFVEGNIQVLGLGSGLLGVEVSMGAAILATLFAYDGWMLVGFVAGEMKNLAKLLPAFRLLSRYMIHSARRYMLQLCK